VRHRETSVILAGGVVKSAFEAGALEVLTSRGVRPRHVVAASSGALNGIVYAAALRAGVEREATARLETLWIEEGNWRHSIDLSVRAILRRQGIATTKKLVELMRREVEPLAALPAVRPVTFTVVITSFNGQTHPIDGHPTTTFESEQTFGADDYASAAAREQMYEVCAASAAFPFLFAPVEVPGTGPCADGGAVNNTPIGIAIDAGAERVILIAPTPADVPPSGAGHGFDLASQLGEILVGERLYRELHHTARVNRKLAGIDRMVADGQLTAAQASAVKDVLGWKRLVEVISIRPATPLAGNVFTGLVCRKLRADYVAAGRTSAVLALDETSPRSS
jgi:NTE family protein